MSWPLKGLLVSSVILLSACATTQKRSTTAAAGEGGVPAVTDLPPTNIVENEDSSEMVEVNAEKPYKAAYGEIALDQNEHVDMWLRYFQGRGRKHMDQYLARSTRYLPMMKNVLRENGLPEDLVYIALIESGFSPRAHSKANAVGYWQFIRSTGKRFGLQIDTFTDERRDPVLSTRAAAEYFKALYGMFNSWHLSMASYNVGEGRVKRAVTRHYTRDFWALIKKRRALPAETKHYVPKFIAAAMIAKNPSKYGFADIEYADPLSYDTVALQSPISLSKLASNLNVEVDELKLLNPKFRTDFVPMGRGGETVVRIPVGRATDAMAALSLSVTTQPKVLQAEYYFYRIRRGDTLSTVARKHRTTVSRLRRLNDLSNRSMLRVGRSLKVPDNGGEGIQYVTEETASTGKEAVPAVQTRDVEFHTVRNGENLSVIATRYGVQVSDLLRMNSLTNRSILRKGQKLRVREGSDNSAGRVKKKPAVLAQFGRAKNVQKEVSAPNSRNVAALSNAAKSRRHVVRRGETLWDVSKRYGVTMGDLAKANNVKINYRVMAGEKLTIPN
ncbi:MAG: LysM peptidoglycan-binding domain-containing protein [Bdellovibrionales bacterium]|nr:LysM peptidoglycan-binding domain-containing protein [Bdellovibrionales bacterium]